MMIDIMTPANIVCPLLILMAIGYYLKRVGMLNDAVIVKMNRIVFHLFIPALMFSNIFNTDIQEIGDLSYLIFGVISVLTIFGLSWLLVPRFVKDEAKCGVVIQGIYRSNYVLMGIAICSSLYGAENIGAAAILIALVVPIYNMLAVLILNVYNKNGRKSLGKTLLDIVKNPIIIAAVLAIVLRLLHVQLPRMVSSVVNDLSKLATPLALILLGGFFRFDFSSINRKCIIWVMIMKILVIPTIFVIISVLLGFTGVELAALMVMFIAPCAVSMFTMAQEMGGDSELACQLVVISSTISGITMFLWILVLNTLGLL